VSRPVALRQVRPDPLGLLLALLALAAGGAAQLYVREQPWWSVAGFALAGVLIALAARRHPRSAEPAPAPPPVYTKTFIRLCGAGVVLCTGAALLVYRMHPPLVTHLVWLAGLLAFAAAAWIGGAAERRAEPRFDRESLLAGAALLLVALIVFGWQLTALPTEVHGDDAEVGLDAVRLLANFNLFGSGWFELPRFHALPTALGLRLFGINLLGLRATSAVLGIGSVLLLFAIARRLWGYEVALLAGLLLAGQRFFMHLSRAGYHYVDTPFASLLVVWLFIRLWQDRRLDGAVWCGVALGLAIQTYYASRLIPILLALTWLCWLLRTPWRELRGRIAAFAVLVVVAVATAAPMFGFFAHDWGDFWKRTRETSIFSEKVSQHLTGAYHTDSLAKIVLIQLRAAVGVFNTTYDTSVQYGLRGTLLEPVSAVLFLLGVALVLARIRERRSQLALLWTALPVVAGAALTIDTPFYPRLSGMVPFAVLLVALALHTLVALVRAAVPTRAGVRLAGVLTIAAVALIYAENLRSYFVDYAARYRHSPCVEISGWVRAHGAGKTTYMVGSAPGFYIRHGAISFLTYGYDTRDVVDLDRYLQTQRFDPATSLFIIMPNGTHVIPRLEQAVGPIDLQSHRNREGAIAFLTAIPQSADTAPPDAENRFDQPSAPSPGIAMLGDVLGAVARGARWLLGAAGAATLLLALVTWARAPRQPGVSALKVPLRERAAAWLRRLVGPDERERRVVLPRAVVIGLLVAIAAVALGLRVHHLVELPAGFFCDEAGNGYNAYSLLHSGRDETGARWPLYVWSFQTSYKNPVFLYSAMLPTALLGPTELAVRLTAALYGFATVLAMFFLGRALLGSMVGLIAALLLAVCPWHLHFSRVGFELITLPFFFTLALTCLVRWTQGRRTLAQAMVLFGICLYTYVPAKLIVPLFLAGFGLLYWRTLRARWRETALAAGLLVLTAAPVMIFDLAHRKQAGSYFSHTTLLARNEPPAVLLRTFAQNYAAFFSPEFLFEDSNDKIIRHRVGGHGQLYLFFAPLLVIGGVVALLRRDRAMQLPLLWLGLYPLAPALMNEIPSASRGIAGAPAFCLVAAIGAGWLLRLAARPSEHRRVAFALQGALALIGLAVLVPAVHAYWVLYRDDYPRYSAKEYTGFQYGHRQVVEYFRQHYDEYDFLLLTTRKSNQPDIFLRFYDGLRQPQRFDIMPPFEHRGNMAVGNAAAYAYYDNGRRLLLAVLPEELPLFADAEVKERILAPDGSAAFVLVAATRLKDFVSTWQVAGPLPEKDRSRPPTWAPDAKPQNFDAVRWRLYDKPAAAVALNDFFMRNAEYACAWAVNFVSTESPRDLRVFAGFDDRGEVWVNGTRVALQRAKNPEASLVDAESGRVRLAAGRNTIAVRSCETVADWRFFFRLENLDGTPVDGLQWEYGPRAGVGS
jgi:4-amino-4-deoxy-L-arabinose transferase-like glycosyltransferase